MKSRPFGVTILAILAGLVALISAMRALQFLGLIPFWLGPIPLRTINIWYALMWGLMVWIYIWLVQMLWRVDKSAWMFLAVITVFNLILDFVLLVTSGTWQEVSYSFILNGIILIYVMLPGVREAFKVD